MVPGLLIRWSCGLLVLWSGSPVVSCFLDSWSGGPHHQIILHLQIGHRHEAKYLKFCSAAKRKYVKHPNMLKELRKSECKRPLPVLGTSRPLVPWSYGQWSSGHVVLWACGPLGLWSSGLWSSGPLMPCFSGAWVLNFAGREDCADHLFCLQMGGSAPPPPPSPPAVLRPPMYATRKNKTKAWCLECFTSCRFHMTICAADIGNRPIIIMSFCCCVGVILSSLGRVIFLAFVVCSCYLNVIPVSFLSFPKQGQIHNNSNMTPPSKKTWRMIKNESRGSSRTRRT